MTTYIYAGPPSGVTLNENGKPREVLLWAGKPVELTPDHPYTLTLLALKHLQEADGQTQATPPAPSRQTRNPATTEVNDAR
ncbi:TPA: hypothetical protein I8Y21_005198 [Klebsiella oxytoca]|uniref:Uncharacterized protein n=1 Tax=Klebsiella oxytoca TaxID=571 RepID=A0AAN5LEB4_KLEOX|nr:hypothetical protein [Klebsiella oxytoca]